MSVIRLLAAAGFVTVSACESGGEMSGTVVTDSAGVRIVTHPPGPRDTLPLVEPLLTIGREGDPLYEFSTIRYVGALSDGRVVVADRGSFQIRHYSVDGTFLSAYGRAGDGPGEFRSFDHVQLIAGDTLSVNDARLGRISFISAEPAVAYSLSYASAFEGMPKKDGMWCQGPTYQGLTAGRRLVFLGWGCWSGEGTEGVRDVFAELRLWNPASGEQRATSPVRWASVYENPALPESQRFTPLPLFGYGYVHPHPQGVLVSVPNAYEVRSLAADGSLVQVIRERIPRRPFDDEMRAREAAELAEAPEAVRRRIERIPFPDSLSSFDRLFVGDGQIWARHDPRGGGDDAFFWSVYALSGEVLGLVQVPRSFNLFSVSRGMTFGVERNELGIERVQVRPVPFGGAPP